MKKFEKRFLVYDSSRADDAERYAFRAMLPYNEVLPKLAATIKRDITPEDMKIISKGGAAFIVDFYKPLFPFPDATFDFNMLALGINIQPLIDQMNGLNTLSYDVDIVGNKLTTSEAQKKQFVEDATRYTTNERQNEALDIIQGISDAYEKLRGMGNFTSDFSIREIYKTCTLLNSENGKVTFNPHQISDIRE